MLSSKGRVNPGTWKATPSGLTRSLVTRVRIIRSCREKEPSQSTLMSMFSPSCKWTSHGGDGYTLRVRDSRAEIRDTISSRQSLIANRESPR